jgi:hypothetical protein
MFCFLERPVRSVRIHHVLPSGQTFRPLRISSRKMAVRAGVACMLMLMVFMPAQSWADVSIAAPGNGVQITGSVPFRAVVGSTGAIITNVRVVDGSTQIGNYVGNGTASIDLRGVFNLAAGTHTITVTGTDANNATYSASSTFTVAGNGSVTQSPSVDSQSPSPVSWQATCTANSGQVITAMTVYLDFNNALASYTGSQSTLSESASFNSTQIPNGPHSLTTNCWDDTGQVYQSSVDFAVGPSFPAGPGNAVVLNMDNPASGWNSCSGCSGDKGGDAGHSMTYPATPPAYPTIDGDSRGFSITSNAGSTFQGFLWDTNFSNSGSQFANGFPVNWLFDYYVNVSNPLLAHYNLEFDGNQTNGLPAGMGYVFGTQCNYGVSQSGIFWRFWNSSFWDSASNSVPCPLGSYGHWYHVQMYFTLNTGAHNYTLQNVRVKDTSTNTVVEDLAPVVTFAATNTTAHGNGIDIQEDGNNNATFPVTYDKIQVIRW